MRRFLQKATAVEGAQPSSPPQRRNFSFAVLFGTFSCGYIAKKKYGNNFHTFHHNKRELPLQAAPLFFCIERTLSVLFFDTAGAKKSTIICFANQTPRLFRACGRDQGRCRLSFRCWTSQKSSIRVASATLEGMTTFTRHHAFLKKLDQNFS